jgi:hypothetical protein
VVVGVEDGKVDNILGHGHLRISGEDYPLSTLTSKLASSQVRVR